MNILNKRRGAANAPSMVCDQTTSTSKDSKALFALQEIRDMAWRHSVKYRFDPVLGQTHKEYLDMLNKLIKECA